MKTVPDICVVIPTLNREKELVDTIHAVLKQSHQNLELLVVDQSQSHQPETAKAIAAVTDKRFRYYLADPPSLPAARNFALRYARAPIVLFLDDDVTLPKDLVHWHLKTFEQHPEISAVAGRVMQKGFPVLPDVLQFDEYSISHGVFTATKPGFTNAFPGGNHSLRVKDALAVGGFDTRYYGSAFREESDMSLRLSQSGRKIYFQPKAELLHLAAHYGGTRVSGHIFDNPTFYKNEAFFTLRTVAKGKRWQAFKLKYTEYCVDKGGRHIENRRKKLFYAGIATALWRLAFGRQIVTRERG